MEINQYSASLINNSPQNIVPFEMSGSIESFDERQIINNNPKKESI